MEDLKIYINSPSKDYKTGLELLKKYGDGEKMSFFDTSNPDQVHYNILNKKLANIFRIALQNKKTSVVVKKPAIEISNKPITVQKMHFSEVIPEISESKMLTNKLLARDWSDLSPVEKKYFNNNQSAFKVKKNLLIENSKIESELKSMHAMLHVSKSDEERKDLAEKMVSLKKRQAINWGQIDNFENIPDEPVISRNIDENDKAALVMQRNNLRSRISKLEKQTKDPSVKKYDSKVKMLEQLTIELEKINSLI